MVRRHCRSILLTLIVLSITLLYVSNISWLFRFSSPFKETDLENVPIVPIASIAAINLMVPIVETTTVQTSQQIPKPNQQITGNNQITTLRTTNPTLLTGLLPEKEDSTNVEKNAERVDSYLDDVKEVVDYNKIIEDEPEFTSKSTVQSVILSYWSSGASFFGEILHSLPDNYYNFEPLMHLGTRKIRNTSDVTLAFNTLRKILQCNYIGLDDYFQSENYELVARRNTLLWNSCQFNTSYCSNPAFVGTFCQMMPYQITTEFRLLAEHSEILLKDSELDVKIVLLIRDPRGIMHSRKQKTWCKGHPDCENMSNLCNDMVADFKAAERLTKKYPNRFAVLRYEDLSLNPFDITQKIFKFYGLPFHENVKQFLATQVNKEGKISTFQDSEVAPFRWAREMSISEVQSIQSECGEAMSLWGYEHVTEEDILKGADYEPLLKSSEAIEEQEVGAEIKKILET